MSPRLAQHRSIGRPAGSARADARGLLLDSAVQQFALKGVAGTTLAGIAAAAAMTPAMVHYYFRDRDQLLDAVASERVAPIVCGVWTPVLGQTRSAALLLGLAQRIIAAAQANEWLPSLWLREVVSDGGQLRARLMKLLPLECVEHLVRTLAREQKAGRLDPDLDPRLAFASVVGLTLLPLASRAIFEQLSPVRGIGPQDIARHARALLANAFSKGPRRRREAGA